jgi:hypothetical protein
MMSLSNQEGISSEHTLFTSIAKLKKGIGILFPFGDI